MHVTLMAISPQLQFIDRQTPTNTEMSKMNPKSLQNLKQPWQPGESGNLNGRPPRARLSEQFISDMAASWSRHGGQILENMAKKDPGRFAGLCSQLIPRDVTLTLEQRLPGNMDPSDWAIVREVMHAVKQALPDANSRPPGEIMQFVLEAIRAASAKTIDVE
jgi:hypothetical protein